MDKRLEGKVAVITGAASGIGASTAKTYVDHGARVVLGDIQDEAGESMAAALGSSAQQTACSVQVVVQLAVQQTHQASVPAGTLRPSFRRASSGRGSAA